MNVQNFQQFNEVQQFNWFKDVQMFKTFNEVQQFNSSIRSRVQLVQRRFKCSMPKNNVIYNNPNFYTELCCEVSGDAARLDTPPTSALDGLR
jgi:hypothetical protein